MDEEWVIQSSLEFARFFQTIHFCGQPFAFSSCAHMSNDCPYRLKVSKGLYQSVRLLLGGLAVAVLIGSPACKKSSNESGKDAPSAKVKTVLHLEPFVVNLADAEDNRFLRVGIDLGLEIPNARAGNEGVVPTSRIRDCILTVLSTWHSDALLAPEGKQKLKEELLRALQERTPELEVKEIYFTDFLVQR